MIDYYVTIVYPLFIGHILTIAWPRKWLSDLANQSMIYLVWRFSAHKEDFVHSLHVACACSAVKGMTQYCLLPWNSWAFDAKSGGQGSQMPCSSPKTLQWFLFLLFISNIWQDFMNRISTIMSGAKACLHVMNGYVFSEEVRQTDINMFLKDFL